MKLVIANFKMNLLKDEIDDYINYFNNKDYPNVFFAPSSIYLTEFVENGLKTVSQDVGIDEKGAYTGDISARQLKSIGVNYSIVGHSERRKYYQDDNYVNKKIKNLLEEEMIPILCIGENINERKDGLYKEKLQKQIDQAFLNIDNSLLSNIIIAYEPIWSIGTGIVPTNMEINDTVNFIKNYLQEKYQVNLKILYGGSVNNSCIKTLSEVIIIDGYLVGGCSINKEEFKKLIEAVK